MRSDSRVGAKLQRQLLLQHDGRAKVPIAVFQHEDESALRQNCRAKAGALPRLRLGQEKVRGNAELEPNLQSDETVRNWNRRVENQEYH